MKQIATYINEKLSINANMDNGKLDVSDVKVTYRTTMLFNASTHKEKLATMDLMKKYFESNKKPKQLPDSTHIWRLADRFMCAVLLEWNDVIIELQDKLYNTKYLPDKNQLQAFFYNMYNIYTNDKTSIYISNYIPYESKEQVLTHLENYFELYNIKI